MRLDQAAEAGKFRATAATSLDGTAGTWGDLDMMCVTLDAAGTFVASTAGNCDGVIWTREGRMTGVATNNEVIGLRKYTVFCRAEFVEAEIGTSPALSAGDDLFATAAGDVTTSPATGDIYVGTVMVGGSRLVINVMGRPVSV